MCVLICRRRKFNSIKVDQLLPLFIADLTIVDWFYVHRNKISNHVRITVYFSWARSTIFLSIQTAVWGASWFPSWRRLDSRCQWLISGFRASPVYQQTHTRFELLRIPCRCSASVLDWHEIFISFLRKDCVNNTSSVISMMRLNED